MLIRPMAVHSPMMTSGLGTRPAIVGGVRKIPLPIVMPTISAMPPKSPITRRRSLKLPARLVQLVQHDGHLGIGHEALPQEAGAMVLDHHHDRRLIEPH